MIGPRCAATASWPYPCGELKGARPSRLLWSSVALASPGRRRPPLVTDLGWARRLFGGTPNSARGTHALPISDCVRARQRLPTCHIAHISHLTPQTPHPSAGLTVEPAAPVRDLSAIACSVECDS
jgi:hypothetical protein